MTVGMRSEDKMWYIVRMMEICGDVEEWLILPTSINDEDDVTIKGSREMIEAVLTAKYNFKWETKTPEVYEEFNIYWNEGGING